LQQIMQMNSSNNRISSPHQQPQPPAMVRSPVIGGGGRNGHHGHAPSTGIKQQILQQQLLRAKNGQHGSSLFRSSGGSPHPFAQFQQRIRQQIHEKQKTGGNLVRNGLFGSTLSTPVKIEDRNHRSGHDDEEEELQVVIRDNEDNGEQHDVDEDSGA